MSGRRNCPLLASFSMAVCSCLMSLLMSVVPRAALGSPDHSQDLDAFLSRGQLVQANEHFSKLAIDDAKDSSAIVALGITQFLQAIEGLGQSNYRYGLLSKYARMLPIARMPIPINSDPDEVSYEDIRSIISTFQTKLRGAEETLAKLPDEPVKLSFFIGRVRLDLNNDGLLSDQETLWRIFAELNSGIDEKMASDFSVGLDNADVAWLRGYCHVLMAACDFALAYDERDLFERCGQLIFPRIRSPYRVSKISSEDNGNDFESEILDAIAAIHLLRFPLLDKTRMASCHEHLLAMVRLSRESWKHALAETDNDREWIPNPKQDSVLRLRTNRDMITGWHRVLDELESVLQGEKLIPFWRLYAASLIRGQIDVPAEGLGVNLKTWFLSPSDFDLVLLIHGSQLESYLEEGPLSTPETWEQLTRVFQGQFFGFAIWFN